MGSKVRKVIAVIAAGMLLLFLGAWRRPSHTGDELKVLGLNPTLGRTILRVDERQGLHQEGMLKAIVRCSGETRAQIRQDPRWQPLPLHQTANILAFREVKEIGKFLPETDNGYFLYLDRDPENADTRDFILAVYDPAKDQIYFVDADLGDAWKS